MKRNLSVGEGYALSKHQPKLLYRYISLLAVIMSMCLYAAKQVSAQQAEPVAAAVADTTIAVRDTLAIEEVQVSTGYQRIPKERATGSFDLIDQKTYSRSNSPNILERLKGLGNGLLFDAKADNPLGISVRGRSTIFSNTQPLVIVDNFPFDGNLSSLNPEDVQNITILKDAAAASIWGTRAGNGVIVITTKKGAFNSPVAFDMSNNITVTERPQISRMPTVSAADFIEMEEFLFEKGYYNPTLSVDYPVVSPVVQLLDERRNGVISEAIYAERINILRQADVMKEWQQYFYRPAMVQQYTLSAKGGGKNHSFYVSGGYNNNRSTEVGISSARYTLKTNQTFTLLDDKLRIATDIQFANSTNETQNPNGYRPYLPYERLADENDNALPALQVGGLREHYTDTAGSGLLLDWKYRPLDELREGYSQSRGRVDNMMINVNTQYHIFNGLSVAGYYQYQKQLSAGTVLHDERSFYTRNLINRYTNIDPATAQLRRPIPIGAIFSGSSGDYQVHNARLQTNFDRSFGNHVITVLAGYEVGMSDYGTNATGMLYGYDPETETYARINSFEEFPYFFGLGRSTINSQNVSRSKRLDRSISYYTNLMYAYVDRYFVSASFRKDQSNIFGVKANQKGVPLGSVGLAWNIHKERFWGANALSSLRLRATYGFSGNVDKTTSAYLTANTGRTNEFQDLYLDISNPPNPSLRWEKVKTINFGVDMALFGNRLLGTLEYYFKYGIDLMGRSPIAPQTGVVSFYGNVADTKTRGMDIKITSRNLTSPNVNWETTVILNLNKDKVTNYKVSPGANADIAHSSALQVVPMEGYPIYSLVSYRFVGLDDTGDALGVLDGEVGKDYAAIQRSSDMNSLVVHGSQTPTAFGSVMNTVQYRQVSLSFNILYKFGHHYRRPSFLSNYLIGGGWMQPDFEKRWQQPGDETSTNVPAFKYPIDLNRDIFYQYASILATPAASVRLNDVRLAYSLAIRNVGWWVKQMEFYAYASNLGIIWRASDAGIDPEATFGYPTPRSVAIGINFKL
ncbi:SusC/RagA family TonB-linked outer membrane protein [Parapedobacter sp. 2B3]|uniref:SusC/RagA family TonB-linked outer membrane protein n=1 Tax=Parapedobacter sp. 2B3 TaxID=3342381 RepID=UPI0035B573EB